MAMKGYSAFPQSSSITGTLPSDCFVSYPGYSSGESYPSAEVQSVYSTAPADWAMDIFIAISFFLSFFLSFFASHVFFCKLCYSIFFCLFYLLKWFGSISVLSILNHNWCHSFAFIAKQKWRTFCKYSHHLGYNNGDSRVEMFAMVRNGHSDPSSNLGRAYLHFTSH